MRTLLVQADPKNFKIQIPDDARVTFGPFSPPTKNEDRYGGTPRSLAGTLRIYRGGTTKAMESILGVFTSVRGFRDISELDYSEEVAREEGAIIWKSDENGYSREEKVKRESEFVDPSHQLETGELPDEGDGVNF